MSGKRASRHENDRKENRRIDNTGNSKDSFIREVVAKKGLGPDLARVRARPQPTEWGPDDLLTLPEAAELFWPQGPLSVRSLRTAADNGQLAVVEIAGKLFTTPAEISAMGRCALRPRDPPPDDVRPPPKKSGPLTLAEARLRMTSR